MKCFLETTLHDAVIPLHNRYQVVGRGLINLRAAETIVPAEPDGSGQPFTFIKMPTRAFWVAMDYYTVRSRLEDMEALL